MIEFSRCGRPREYLTPQGAPGFVPSWVFEAEGGWRELELFIAWGAVPKLKTWFDASWRWTFTVRLIGFVVPVSVLRHR